MQFIKKTPSAYVYPLLIKNLLTAPLQRPSDRKIVYQDKFSCSYSEFAERVARQANLLDTLGIKPGDRVGVMDWDSHRYLESYFAVPMTGAVLHTINIRLSPDQLVYTINHARDKVLFVHEDFLPLLDAVKDRLETVIHFVMLSDGDCNIPEKGFFGEYEGLISTCTPDYLFEDFDENTMATLFYTTGTTGLPKGVYFSHRQIVLHTYGFMSGLAAYDGGLKVDAGDVYMPLTPMFHVHAWGMPYLFTMLGNTQVYPGRFLPDTALALAAVHQVTFSHCVPTIIHMLLNSPAMDKMEFADLKMIIGGSALNWDLCRRAQEKGIRLFAAYGMSETCPLLTVSDLAPEMKEAPVEEQIRVRCLTGRPVPNVQLEIVDPMGAPLPHDGQSAGEIVVRSPWLTQGYYRDEAKSEALWKDGWLHTGDIGTINPDGYVKITDRIKDVIKTGGEWISSLDLEDIITRHEAVSEAAVIGMPDEKWGERPLAIVVVHPAYRESVTQEALKEFFLGYAQRGEIPKYGVPERIEIVEKIAKTSVGKINKKELRQQYNQI